MSLRTWGIANNHIRLARKGDVIDGVTVSETNMPDFSPTSNWTKLTDSVTTLTDTPVRGSEVDLMVTVAGQQKLRDKIGLGPLSRTITWSQMDADERIDELRTMSGKINTTGADDAGEFVEFTPFAGGAEGVTGWFHIQQYNQEDELVYIEVVWGELRLANGITSGNNAVTPQLALTVYPNPLNLARRYRPTVSSN